MSKDSRKKKKAELQVPKRDPLFVSTEHILQTHTLLEVLILLTHHLQLLEFEEMEQEAFGY